MRTTHIEHRDRGIWPALLVAALLLVLVLGWWLWPSGDERLETTDLGTVSGEAPLAAPAPVGDFLRFVDERQSASAMGPEHEYTADGIRRLSAALDAIARQNGATGADIEREAEMLRDRADRLQRDPQSTNHAGTAREAFVSLAGLMSALQQRQPGAISGTDEVREAAEAIAPGRPLLEQRSEVQAFFQRAADALRGAANTPR